MLISVSIPCNFIFDLVILLIIADVASLGLDNSEFFLSSVLCLVILTALQKLVSVILLNNSKLREVVDGSPTIIVYDGVIKYKNMRKEFYNIDDLISQMRLDKVLDVNEIKLAILETSGKLTIFKKKDSELISYPIISSGKYIDDTFEVLNISKLDIDDILIKNNLKLTNILYASYHKGVISYYEKHLKEENIRMKKISLI